MDKIAQFIMRLFFYKYKVSKYIRISFHIWKGKENNIAFDWLTGVWIDEMIRSFCRIYIGVMFVSALMTAARFHGDAWSVVFKNVYGQSPKNRFMYVWL